MSLAKRSLLMHCFTYLLVCSFLVAIDLTTGTSGPTFIGLDWAFWPIMGWGIGLVLHAISVALGLTNDREPELKAQ